MFLEKAVSRHKRVDISISLKTLLTFPEQVPKKKKKSSNTSLTF